MRSIPVRTARVQTGLGYVGYLFIGTSAVLVPLTMPFITEEYVATGLTVAAIGLIFPARSVGGILGNLLSGVASDLMGRWRLIWLAALFLGFALALTAAARIWLLFVIGFVLVSMAQGSLATGINAMVADANRGARARSLNILHGVYGAGAAISPLVIGVLIASGLPWRWVLAGTGLLWLSYALVAFLLRANDGSVAPEGRTGHLDFGMLVQTPFLALFLIAFIYNAIAYSLLGWIGLYVQQTTDLSPIFSAGLISLFYIALTLGRFVCAGYADRGGYAHTLKVLSIGLLATYPLVLSGFSPILLAAGVFLTGLSVSGLFPIAQAYASRLYPAQTGTTSGTLNAALTLGGMLPPLWTGVIAAQWGFQVALGVNYFMGIPLILLAFYLGRVEVKFFQDVALGRIAPDIAA